MRTVRARHSRRQDWWGPRLRAKRFLAGAAFAVALAATAAQAQTAPRSLEQSVAALEASQDYIRIGPGDGVDVDLRYASASNFVGEDLYGPLRNLYLHRVAAERLRRAAAILKERRPDLRLVVFDGLRPRSVQARLWSKVKGTAQQRYVANPASGSIHNYGLAVDLSLKGADGRELDMGTPFDDFSALSQPAAEARFLKTGKLTQAQVDNRRTLRDVMQAAGFRQLPLEWWHFDALPPGEVRRKHRIVE